MKLILLDGGPASGKNTFGTLLVQKFMKVGNQAVLLDLDTYVERLNPTWIWKNKEKEEKDQKEGRINFARDITKYLLKDYIIIAFGERFLTKENISNFIKKIKIACPIYLYHLSIPFSLRIRRLHERGPHSLIDLEADQKDRDLNPKWYGYVYENINSPQQDSENIYSFVKNNKGLLDLNEYI